MPCSATAALDNAFYISGIKKGGFAPPSVKLEDEFCSSYSSSALASSSLLDNTAGIIQTRECDVKGEGPSNIWTCSVFSPFLCIYIC